MNSQPPPPSMPLSDGFARASYLPRVVGLALGFITLASVLAAHEAPWWVWLGPALHGFAWPHLAWLRARRAQDPVATERSNMLVDHAAGGLWIVAIGFNALPSVLMLAMMGMDSLIAGGRRHFARGMGAHAAGIAFGMLMYGVNWQPESSMLQVVACLPLLLLHPLAVGAMTSRALRKLAKQREELIHLSQHDGLSGLYNRRTWEMWGQAEFNRFQRTGEVASLVLIDFDHFKQVNDTLGHTIGDEVIRQFSERLRCTLRSIDIPGRFGGEEFGVLLVRTSPNDAVTLMRRLQASLHEEPLLTQRVVTVSMGVASLTPDLPNYTAWVRLADQMLYRAKDQGRDCVVVAGDAVPSANHARAVVQTRIDASINARVLLGLELIDIAAAVFDPSDRLAWANEGFRRLYGVTPTDRTFADIMRHCHSHRLGPRIDTADIAVWLTAADAKRRSQPRRSFIVDMLDGRKFRVEEGSFENGWLLAIWQPYQDACRESTTH